MVTVIPHPVIMMRMGTGYRFTKNRNTKEEPLSVGTAAVMQRFLFLYKKETCRGSIKSVKKESINGAVF